MSEAAQFSDAREYQIKVLAYMLSDHDFCKIAKDVLKDEHFSDRALQWFFEAIAQAELRLSPASLKHEMVKAVQNKIIRENEFDRYIEYYGFLCQKPLPFEEEHIRAELGHFIREQATKKAIQDSWTLAKTGDWDQIVEIVTSAVNQGLDHLDVGDFYFAGLEQRLEDRKNEISLPKLPTWIPDLDDLMFGGLKPKQMGLAAGGTGRGKSVLLAWLARVGVLLNKKVVYYTCELSKEDVAERFDSLFAHIQINELKSYDNEVFTALDDLRSKFGNNLVIKEYPPDTATVSTIKAHLRQLANIGFYPDLVLIDYLDLLAPHRHYNSQHEELDAITKGCRGIAVEFNTRVWTVTQLNRSGMAAETPDETSVAGAVSKLFTADVSILMAQTPDERLESLMRLIVVKNRNGPAGKTVSLTTDFAYMTFFKECNVSMEAEEVMHTLEEAKQLSAENLKKQLQESVSVESEDLVDIIEGVVVNSAGVLELD